MKRNTTIGILLCATTAACAPSPDDAADDGAEFRGSTKSDGYTWKDRTGNYRNSPRADTHSLSNFLEDPSLGSGLALAAIEDPNGQRDQVVFDGDELVAYTPSGDLRGANLVGSTLIFEISGSEYGVYIGSYSDQPDWVSGALIPTYGLANVEKGPSGDPIHTSVCSDLEWNDDTNVVFIPGETYDEDALTVQANALGSVTMACQGHAIAKLKFVGADPGDAYGSDWKDRQAALKMLTADYCGSGDSYTTLGQPLDWHDRLGRFTLGFFPTFDDLEARFDHGGATCLNTPRNPAVERDQVHCVDELPKCTSAFGQLLGADWASYHG